MTIRKAAVLGAGVMGSAIAAHLANASIPTLLLDIVPREPDDKEKAAGLGLDAPEVRNRLALSALEAMKKASPAPFAHADRIRLVTPGNFEDDLEKLADVDWVVEAVVAAWQSRRPRILVPRGSPCWAAALPMVPVEAAE